MRNLLRLEVQVTGAVVTAQNGSTDKALGSLTRPIMNPSQLKKEPAKEFCSYYSSPDVSRVGAGSSRCRPCSFMRQEPVQLAAQAPPFL